MGMFYNKRIKEFLNKYGIDSDKIKWQRVDDDYVESPGLVSKVQNYLDNPDPNKSFFKIIKKGNGTQEPLNTIPEQNKTYSNFTANTRPFRKNLQGIFGQNVAPRLDYYGDQTNGSYSKFLHNPKQTIMSRFDPQTQIPSSLQQNPILTNLLKLNDYKFDEDEDRPKTFKDFLSKWNI